MAFIARVLRDALRLLVAAPVDLIVAVAVVLLVGAILSLSRSLGLFGLMFHFAGSTLLTAGLLGRPTPDRLPAAVARLARRIVPAVGQVLVVTLLLIGVGLLYGTIVAVLSLILPPDFRDSLTEVGTTPLHPITTASLVVLAIVIAWISGRLLPSAGLVLDRDVGAFESLRLAWSATRRRAIACAALFVIVTAPSYLFFLVLPADLATFLAIFSLVAAVATGVAAYRVLMPDLPAAEAAPIGG